MKKKEEFVYISELTFIGGLRGCVEPIVNGNKRNCSGIGSNDLEGPLRGP